MNAGPRLLVLGLALAVGASGCAVDPPVARARSQMDPGAQRWSETVNAATAAAYLTFLNTASYSDPRAAQARDACRALILDGRAAPGDALAYLRLFPADPDAQRVRAALAKLRFAAARASADPDDAALFAAQYPGTADAEALADQIRRREFQRAEALGTRLGYRYFLERHPSAPEAKTARERLAAFASPAIQAGDESDLALLPRLRAASPLLVRLECRGDLQARLRLEKDAFGVEAENLRQRLARLAKAGAAPEFCSGRPYRVPKNRRQFVAGAVRALALLQQRRSGLGDAAAGPDKLASDAQDVGARAATLADDAESQDLELEAFYGGIAADPKRPDDTATKNAREALRRAKRVFELSRGLGDANKKKAAADLLAMMDRQAELLTEIIADNERPADSEAEQEAAD